MCDCKTKYPILLVHGTGFRDRKYFGYWGRIPQALETHGAAIAYGNQDSWGTIEHNSGILRRNLPCRCSGFKEKKILQKRIWKRCNRHM